MPQAIQPSPLSSHSPLSSQRLLLRGLELAHDGKLPQIPLQTTIGASHMQVIGLEGGEGVKPSQQVKPQGLLETHAGVLWSG
jgi:hypothetical protein